MKKFLIIAVLFVSLMGYNMVSQAALPEHVYQKNMPMPKPAIMQHHQKPITIDPMILNWMTTNVSPSTQMPLSFEIPLEDQSAVFSAMGLAHSPDGIIERTIVEEGLVVYDGAVGQIVRALVGRDEDLKAASLPLEVYWQGFLRDLSSVRAGYPINQFVYDPSAPTAVSSDLDDHGSRGFIFRIINAHGRYLNEDPLDGKTHADEFPTWPRIHWEDWKPVAGENAWIVMAAMHVYAKKYMDPREATHHPAEHAIELRLAEELARAAMFLQADNGGIRMAPIGTFMQGHDDGKGWYQLISTENNLSWYAAFRMLYHVTKNPVYAQALEKMDEYFKTVWNTEDEIFEQGMQEINGQWRVTDEHFATDVQTWGILVLGCEKIDGWFGEGCAYRMWEKTKHYAGSYTSDQKLRGVGFTSEHDRVSVEWTAGAIMAARALSDYYKDISLDWFESASNDATWMRQGIEFLRKELPGQRAAYSYSSKRAWIPFGWFSHDPNVLSLASTAWVVLVDANVNPFDLP